MTQEQVELFTSLTKTQLTTKCRTSRCVDGRYKDLQDFPMIAKPGGDAGDLLAAFAALNELGIEVDSSEVVKAIVAEVGGIDKFCFHTDDHAEEESGSKPGMGCGHLKQAKLDPEAYGVTAQQMDFIFTELPGFISSGATQEVLHGDHAEQAVIVVDSEHYGLKPQATAQDGTFLEAFIYEKTIHEQQLDVLASELQSIIAQNGMVKEQQEIRLALEHAFSKQLSQTLNRLAKDLPVYQVSIDEAGESNVTAL